MKAIGFTRVYWWIKQQDKRYLVFKGGAGSSKSYSIAQHLVLDKCSEPNKNILIFRKTFPSLKTSCISLIIQLLQEYEIPYSFNKTDSLITFSNNTKIKFNSLDDPEKIKSWHEPHYIWLEEATEIPFDTFLQLDIRMRGQNDKPNQMFLSFNPIDANHWLKTDLVENSAYDIALNESNMYDNPFLPVENKRQLENLINVDKNFYDVYVLNKWGVLENVIYKNYDAVDSLPCNPDQVFYGVDFGFNNPSAVVKIVEFDGEYWLEELLYESKLTNSDLIGRLEGLGIGEEDFIYADCAEPQRIEEIYQAGFNIHPAIKDKNSVKDGIDFCKRLRLHVLKSGVNLLKEFSGYSWKEDKDGNVLDEPVKFNDHAMDAFRYALYTHVRHFGGTSDFFLE